MVLMDCTVKSSTMKGLCRIEKKCLSTNLLFETLTSLLEGVSLAAWIWTAKEVWTLFSPRVSLQPFGESSAFP